MTDVILNRDGEPAKSININEDGVNDGGRPLLFKDPKELEKHIEDYFNKCDKGYKRKELNKRGDVVEYDYQRPYTLEGLGLHLNCSTETIRNYAKSAIFFDIVSRARQRIWMRWIELGATGQYNPKIVALNLAANNQSYNIVKQTESNDTLTIEGKLRAAKQIEEHVPEAQVEVVESDDK